MAFKVARAKKHPQTGGSNNETWLIARYRACQAGHFPYRLSLPAPKYEEQPQNYRVTDVPASAPITKDDIVLPHRASTFIKTSSAFNLSESRITASAAACNGEKERVESISSRFRIPAIFVHNQLCPPVGGFPHNGAAHVPPRMHQDRSSSQLLGGRPFRCPFQPLQFGPSDRCASVGRQVPVGRLDMPRQAKQKLQRRDGGSPR